MKQHVEEKSERTGLHWDNIGIMATIFVPFVILAVVVRHNGPWLSTGAILAGLGCCTMFAILKGGSPPTDD